MYSHTLAGLLAQASTSRIDQIITRIQDTVVAVAPDVLFAAVILVLGFVVARVLDGQVYEFGWRHGVDERFADTALGSVLGDQDDAVADALGATVRYLVYAVAVAIAVGYLGISQLDRYVDILVGYVPNALGAVVVLLVGVLVAHFLRGLVTRLVGRTGVGASFGDTLVGRAFDAGEGTLATLAGYAVALYVYLLTLYAAANVAALGVLTPALYGLLQYVPVFVGALVLAAAGALIAEYAGRTAAESEAANLLPVGGIVGGTVEALVYLFTAVITLSALGVSTTLLVTLLAVTVLPVSLALALAVGISFGYGGRDHAADYLDDQRAN